jgi:drug/metabolite transporter (DMT)-like permease
MRYKGLNFIRDFPTDLKWAMLMRAVAGSICFLCFMKCLDMIPMSVQIVIVCTTPFWTSIIAYFVFNDPIIWFEVVAMVISFSGVIGIALFSPEPANDGTIYDDGDKSNTTFYMGIALAFFIAWIVSLINISNRKMKDIHFSMVMFGHALFGFIVAIGYYLI